MSGLLTCIKCGWVAFGVPRETAEKEVKAFNSYFESLTDKQRLEYYGNKPANIAAYERCFNCRVPVEGNMRRYRERDCPDGVTLQGIISPTTIQP